MKKILILMTVLFSQVAIADEQVLSTVVCPKEIICDEDQHLNSCKIVDDNNAIHWEISTLNNEIDITQGSYQFNGTSAWFPTLPPNLFFTSCAYENQNAKSKTKLIFIHPHDNNLIAHVDSSTHWLLFRGTANCYNSIREACPLDVVRN